MKLGVLAGAGDARIDATLQASAPGVERGRVVFGARVREEPERGETEALVGVQIRPVAQQRFQRAARARVTGVARANQQAWNRDQVIWLENARNLRQDRGLRLFGHARTQKIAGHQPDLQLYAGALERRYRNAGHGWGGSERGAGAQRAQPKRERSYANQRADGSF